MRVRIEKAEGGEVLYLALDPDGVWARSEFPHALVTLDYNAQGKLIGVEALGNVARVGANGLLAALMGAEDLSHVEEIRDVLTNLADQ